MNPALADSIETLIGAKLIRSSSLSGGDISTALKVETTTGLFFVKYNTDLQAKPMFEAEAKGLELLRKSEALVIPKVIAFDTNLLILEYIPIGTSSNQYWENGGRQLAQLHRINSSHFGLDHDNYIGSLLQNNKQLKEWAVFYAECRLIPQFQSAFDNGFFSSSNRLYFEKLIRNLPDILPEEAPSLIHGDLWSGNIFADINGNPVLIDPAVCFAHREMDIAMSLLFGGFGQGFYDSYQDEFPLEESWHSRIELYQLYYLLVHVNLFGRSYVSSCTRILDKYR